MDPLVSVRNVMNQDYVGVSESDPLRGVAQLLDESTGTAAVVLRGSEPTGVITNTDIVSVVAEGRVIEELTAENVMSGFASISIDRPVDVVVEQLREHAVLLVLDDTTVVGTIEPSDLVPVASLLVETTEPDHLTPLRESTDFEPQGICEQCGSLTQTLRELHGQIVCPDCLTT